MRDLLYLSFGALISLSSCQNNATNKLNSANQDPTEIVDAHTSQNSLDWAGTYEGTTPCADCPGIEQTVTLNQNNTFHATSDYLERDVQLKDSGNFVWLNNGSQIAINTQNTQMKFKVQEGSLKILDTEGKEIAGTLADKFILIKK